MGSRGYAHSKIELKFSCHDLPDLDILSKTDPQVFLFAQSQRTRQWRQTQHKTEIVRNSLNPKFVTGFILDYLFEELQRLRFVVVDVDKPNNPDWQAQEFVGQFETDLGSIVGSEGNKIKGKLFDPKHPNKDRGTITISAEEVSETKRRIKLQFQAHNVIKKAAGIFSSKHELFFVISRANEDNTFSPVYESIAIVSSNPFWPEFMIKESTLCNGDQDRALEISVKQHKKNGDHQLLGKSTVTLREILAGGKTFKLGASEKDDKKSRRTSAMMSKGEAYIRVVQVSVQQLSFLDYIAGGTELNLVVAIDLTASNGNPLKPYTLHYTGGGENEYQKAIRSVGTILQSYDNDRKFPVYGFGAKFNGVLSHAYPLNGNFDNPRVDGVDGILTVYRQVMSRVELYGPTNFSPIINQTAEIIRHRLSSRGENVYYTLLIITDGVITDMDSTVRAIVKASSLPFSIVIVGVGTADFSAMEILDADDKPLQANKEVMERDIVQFVAMRDFQAEHSQYELPKAVLEEIPDQFMSYMMKNNITPRPPVRVDSDELQIYTGPPPEYTPV